MACQIFWKQIKSKLFFWNRAAIILWAVRKGMKRFEEGSLNFVRLQKFTFLIKNTQIRTVYLLQHLCLVWQPKSAHNLTKTTLL